ncbi:hypothetical protein [Pectobacterium carotovorum]|uniref:hypothetical protein n=1 Tax=Pectobacterium carotovorum TaxID=554 RepID=UPI001314CF18|nr:hypothetical protein [Pectobacterium carotovorum]
MKNMKLTFKGKDIYVSHEEIIALMSACEKALLGVNQGGCEQHLNQQDTTQYFNRYSSGDDRKSYLADY